MPAVVFSAFGGELPAQDPRKLPDEAATVARNCEQIGGRFASYQGLANVAGTLRSGHIRSIFEYAAGKVCSWNSIVRAIRSPLAQDAYDRLYYVGDSYPRVTRNDTIGTGAIPAASHKLGVPRPNAPAVSINRNGVTNTDTTDDRTIYYRVTYVTALGEEGPASLPSNQLTAWGEAAETATITVPNLASNPYNVTKGRVYRTATSGGLSAWLYVGEATLGSTVVDTNVADDANLGPELATEDFYPPPDNLAGLVALPGGITLGFAGNELVPSEPYLPYAYPYRYRLSTNEQIVALGVTSAGVVVATTGNPYLLTGISPDSLSLTRLDMAAACVSARSMVDMGEFVIYASDEGLVAAGGNMTPKILTKEVWSLAQWKALKPATIHAYRWNDKYLAFYGDTLDSGVGVGGFVFDPNTGDLRMIDTYATAGFTRPDTGDVILVVGDALKLWASEAIRMVGRWRSRKVATPWTSFSAFRVIGEGMTNSTLRVFADDVLVLSVALTGDDFTGRLPAVQGKDWQVEIEGRAPVSMITLATSMSEL